MPGAGSTIPNGGSIDDAPIIEPSDFPDGELDDFWDQFEEGDVRDIEEGIQKGIPEGGGIGPPVPPPEGGPTPGGVG